MVTIIHTTINLMIGTCASDCSDRADVNSLSHKRKDCGWCERMIGLATSVIGAKGWDTVGTHRSHKLSHTRWMTYEIKIPWRKLLWGQLWKNAYSVISVNPVIILSTALQMSLLQWWSMGKMFFWLQGIFLLQYWKWPLEINGPLMQRPFEICPDMPDGQ